MRERRYWKAAALIFALASTILGAPGIVRGHEPSPPKVRSTLTGSASRNVIIIGFVGGFVSRDDIKHPEVQFCRVPSRPLPLLPCRNIWESPWETSSPSGGAPPRY
jgi:hypothetical protein